jgi:hypothetical protein
MPPLSRRNHLATILSVFEERIFSLPGGTPGGFCLEKIGPASASSWGVRVGLSSSAGIASVAQQFNRALPKKQE